MKLIFGKANAKLQALEKRMNRRVGTFSQLSGHTCPFAEQCLSMALVDTNGKRYIQDGPETEYRCYSASQEAQYAGVYNSRSNNHFIIDIAAKYGYKAAADVIIEQMPTWIEILRIHVGGGFKKLSYFDTWIEVARRLPAKLFYTYVKSLPFWVARINDIPDNFVLTASYGGKMDHMISQYDLRYVKVVPFETKQEAIDAGMLQCIGRTAECLNLELDHDDYHAAEPSIRDIPFALLIHGSQPKGSDMAKAKSANKGKGSYSVNAN
jgi:hypothetical protein